MILRSTVGISLLLATSLSVLAQTSRPRTVPANPNVIVTETIPMPKPTPVTASRPAQPATIVISPDRSEPSRNQSYRSLSFSQIKSKIAEAKRQMQVRPVTTAAIEPEAFTSVVRIAYYDWNLQQIDYVVLTKDQFLTPDTAMGLTSTHGKQVIARTIRANGVNTPVTITDVNGQAELPLLVQYPVEKGGRFIETAYYMSTHPGLVTPEVVGAGQFYVHNVIEIARERLSQRGIKIQPKVADIAERLATVEHVDHLRFRTEIPADVFNDIFTLYALNEGQTYRYSVSSAGAGGMVQMIPSTYAMIRRQYPNVPLDPDFVDGMRNHVNATQAMLLYMQMTWNDLSSRSAVSDALATGIATQEQLMAAGYNSNPAKLAGYINRGGENWTTLIPRETKIYLQIYDALEKAVKANPRKQ